MYPLPIASVIDRIVPFDEMTQEPDFVYVDAGDPLDNPVDALPYLGPNWYWRHNGAMIMENGYSKAGKITKDDFK